MGLPILLTAQNKGHSNSFKQFAISYNKLAPNQIQRDLDLLILESSHYSPLEVKALKKKGIKLVGYLSLTEISKNAHDFESYAAFTIGENSNWSSCYLDLSIEKLRQLLIIKAKEIIGKGFDGIFLDNIDNVTQWGKLHFLKEELVSFIGRLKDEVQPKMLIQNSGLELIKENGSKIDAVLVESIASNFDFISKSYLLREENDYKNRRQKIIEFSKTYEKPILVVEYANTMDLAEQVLEQWKNTDIGLFITNVELNKIPNFFLNAE